MGLSDFYYSLEDKWYKLVDKLNLHWLTDKVDKVMPSMVFFGLLFLIIIIVLAVLLFPSNEPVTINFVQDGLTIQQDFNFNVSVDNGKLYSGLAKNGVAIVKLPKGESIEVSDFSLKKFKPSKTSFTFANTINVPMLRIYSNMPISLHFYLDNSPFVGTANASFSCSDVVLPSTDSSSLLQGSSLEIEVPENCGTLTVSTASDGLKASTTQCNSTTCMVYLEPATTVDDGGEVHYATGTIRITILDTLGKPVSDAEVSVYEERDLQTAYDLGRTNSLGMREFQKVVVGNYKVFAQKDGFMTESINVYVSDNQVTEKQITLSVQNLGQVFFKFRTEDEDPVEGEFILRDSEQSIIHRGNADENGMILVPIYAFDKIYYFDFAPEDKNLMPISVEEVTFDKAGNVLDFTVYEKTMFDLARINIRVVDQDNNPVKGAKIFVKDNLSGFELLAASEDIDKTDENGETSVTLEDGMYVLRAYSGITEGMSETISILPVETDELPEYNTTITLYYGYDTFDLSVYDEFGLPLGYSVVNYFVKGGSKNDDEGKVLGPEGKLIDTFKVGQYKYFKVSGPEGENYLPFTSEARFLMPNEKWDANVVLEQVQDNSPTSKFLGVYDYLGGEEVYNLAIGGTYYVGYDIYLYDKKDFFIFEFKTGNKENDVNKDKLFIVDYYTSSDSDVSYSDVKKENTTESDKKIIRSKWNNGKKGVYRVFYKVQIRNDSSVRMYDQLNFNWRLYIDDETDPVASKTDVYLVGGKSECQKDSFCARINVLDVKEKLYVDQIGFNKYMLAPNKDYNVEFDLINGIDGIEGEIRNGYLQVYNAGSDGESIEVVKNNTSLRSFLKLTNIHLDGPSDDDASYDWPTTEDMENSESPEFFVKERYALFKPGYIGEAPYDFTNFTKNLYIHGKMSFASISKESSYVNFTVVDADRMVVVKGKPAFSINVAPVQAKPITVEIFPESLLIPEMSQLVDVYVLDESGSAVVDAYVTFKMKHVSDTAYKIYTLCSGIKTDVEGKATCRIASNDATLGTYFQVQVEKEGYEAYYHTDFTPDLKVADELVTTSPTELETNLLYPVMNESTTDLTVINNSAVTLTIDHLDLEFDKYSEPFMNALDVEAMRNYMVNSYQGKEVIGRVRGAAGQAETPFVDFFKAKLNRPGVTDLEDKLDLSGIVKIYFKTGTGKELSHEVPFQVSVVVDGYPTNPENCLNAGFDEEFFSSDGAKTLSIPFTFVDSCVISTSDGVYPVTFDNLYAIIDVKSGSMGLGQITGMQLQPVGITADAFVTGIPKSIGTNVETDIYMPEHIGTIGFAPTGKRGATEYTLKFVGFVKTSEGIKRVESKPVSFSVSVLNLEDCIKIYDADGKELSLLTFDVMGESEISATLQGGNYTSIKIKNVCENVPLLKLRMCYDNNGLRSQSCGTLLGNPVAGIDFEDRMITDMEGIDLELETDISVKRPGVPGAYGIDVWAKLPDQFSFKRVAYIKTNVKTTLQSGLFSDYPFLETYSGTKEVAEDISTDYNNSDAISIYNANIGKDSLHSIMNKEIYKKILKDSEENVNLDDSSCYPNTDKFCFIDIKAFQKSALHADRVQPWQAGEGIINLGANIALLTMASIAASQAGTAVGAGTAIGSAIGGTTVVSTSGTMFGARFSADVTRVSGGASGVAIGAAVYVIVMQVVLMAIAASVEADEAALAYTIVGGATAAAGVVIAAVAIAGAGACATGVGCILSAASLLIAATTWLITAAFMSGLQVNDDFTYILPLNSENLLQATPFGSAIDLNVNDVFHYTGEDKFTLISHQKQVRAYTGMLGDSWGGELGFNVQCPPGYEVVQEGIIPLESEDTFGSSDNSGDAPRYAAIEDDHSIKEIYFQNCGWGEPTYEIQEGEAKNRVHFNVKCSAGPYEKLKLNTYALIPCKPKDYLWGRMQTKGVDAGYPNTGLLKYYFENVDFANFYADEEFRTEGQTDSCDEEWCYKVINLQAGTDAHEIFGDVNDQIRIAFHNPKKEPPQVFTNGTPCTDPVGNVIGFTGEEAAPKVEYNWKHLSANGKGIVDENFCSVFDENKEAKRYCDATQLFASSLRRIDVGNDKLKDLISENGWNLECPSLPPSNSIERLVTIMSGDTNILGEDEPTVGFNDDRTIVQLIVPLKSTTITTGMPYPIVSINIQPTTTSPTIIETQKDCDITVRSQDPVGGKVEIQPICIVDLVQFNHDLEDYPSTDMNYDMYTGTLMSNITYDNVIHRMNFNVRSKINQYKKRCLLTNASTEVIGGRMKVYQFYDINLAKLSEENDENELMYVQNLFNYQAYLMDDGYSLDFLKDFANACSTEFLHCPAGIIERYVKMINENRVIVANMYDGSSRTNGPGLYNIHLIVTYPDFETKWLNLDENNVTLAILLEKVKGPDRDSMFYYMPLNGRTGIVTDTVDRQGYGVDYTGDLTTIYDLEGIDTLQSGLSSSSNALKTLNINTDFDFGKANKYRRGLIFEAKQIGEHNIDVQFNPDLYVMRKQFKLGLKDIDTDTRFLYKMTYNNQPITNTLITLPWYVSPKYRNLDDFTGQKLVDTYPKVSMLATSSDGIQDYEYYAKIEYPAKQVTTDTRYNIYTLVYGRQNDDISIKEKGINVDIIEKDSAEISLSVEAFNHVIDQIKAGMLCIGGNSTDTFVFVNENQIVNDTQGQLVKTEDNE